jgi:DNA-binding NtrC family response regulator
MDEPIVVVDANEEQCQELCAMLEGRHYRAIPMYSFTDLEKYLMGKTCLVVVLDLNTLSLDNSVIRELTVKNPGVCFLGLTKHRFNPELEEAICYHVYACLTKPVDLDELVYWIMNICEDESGLKKPPEP